MYCTTIDSVMPNKSKSAFEFNALPLLFADEKSFKRVEHTQRERAEGAKNERMN